MNTLITPQHLTAEVEATLSDLRTCLRGFGDAALNRRPQPDSWTAGQVVEHILKSAGHAIRAVNGPAAPTGRRPDEKVAVLHAAFLEDDGKLKSSDFVAPGSGPHTGEALAAAVEDVRRSAGAAIPSRDLAQLCTGFDLPALGALTRLEWVCFALYHTRRHIHQLDRIAQSLGIEYAQESLPA